MYLYAKTDTDTSAHEFETHLSDFLHDDPDYESVEVSPASDDGFEADVVTADGFEVIVDVPGNLVRGLVGLVGTVDAANQVSDRIYEIVDSEAEEYMDTDTESVRVTYR